MLMPLRASVGLLVVALTVAACGTGDRQEGQSDGEISAAVSRELDSIPEMSRPEAAGGDWGIPPLSSAVHFVECEQLPQISSGVERLASEAELSILCIVVRNGSTGSAEEILSGESWEAGFIATADRLDGKSLETLTMRDIARAGGSVGLLRPAGAWAVSSEPIQNPREVVGGETGGDSVVLSFGDTSVGFGRVSGGTSNAWWTFEDDEGQWAMDIFMGAEPSLLAASVTAFIGSAPATAPEVATESG
jgi:hypothetical protein